MLFLPKLLSFEFPKLQNKEIVNGQYFLLVLSHQSPTVPNRGMGEDTQLFNSSAQTRHRHRRFSYNHLQEGLEKVWAEAVMRNAPLCAVSFSFSLPVLGPCSQAYTKHPPQSSLMRDTITEYKAALKNAYFSHRSKYQLKLSLKFYDMKQMYKFS